MEEKELHVDAEAVELSDEEMDSVPGGHGKVTKKNKVMKVNTTDNWPQVLSICDNFCPECHYMSLNNDKVCWRCKIQWVITA